MVDQVGELRPIGGRAARIDVEHHIAGRRVELIVGGEHRSIARERSAVDLQDQRILLGGLEVRRRDQPGVDGALVEGRGDRQRGRLSQRLAEEQVVVEPGQPAQPALADHGQVGRMLLIADGDGQRAVGGKAVAAAAVGAVQTRAGEPLGERDDLPVQKHAGYLGHPVVDRERVEALAVRGP